MWLVAGFEVLKVRFYGRLGSEAKGLTQRDAVAGTWSGGGSAG